MIIILFAHCLLIADVKLVGLKKWNVLVFVISQIIFTRWFAAVVIYFETKENVVGPFFSNSAQSFLYATISSTAFKRYGAMHRPIIAYPSPDKDFNIILYFDLG